MVEWSLLLLVLQRGGHKGALHVAWLASAPSPGMLPQSTDCITLCLLHLMALQPRFWEAAAASVPGSMAIAGLCLHSTTPVLGEIQ